jgi:hypothetical protein
MAFTLCIKDRFGDVHARRENATAEPESIERLAREFAADLALDSGEHFKVGLGQPADPGLARLRDGVPYADGGIEWLYELENEQEP